MVKKVVETMLKQQITTETKFEEKEVPELSKIIADSIRHQLSGLTIVAVISINQPFKVTRIVIA